MPAAATRFDAAPHERCHAACLPHYRDCRFVQHVCPSAAGSYSVCVPPLQAHTECASPPAAGSCAPLLHARTTCAPSLLLARTACAPSLLHARTACGMRPHCRDYALFALEPAYGSRYASLDDRNNTGIQFQHASRHIDTGIPHQPRLSISHPRVMGRGHRPTTRQCVCVVSPES